MNKFDRDLKVEDCSSVIYKPLKNNKALGVGTK